MSDTTPLLVNCPGFPHDVYARFTPAQKKLITRVISLVGLMATFATACFVPSVPEIAKDLNTTGTVVNFTVGAYILVVAVGNLIWAPYAAFYGRQPVYLASLPLVCVGAIGTGLARNVPQLVVGRIIQGFGSACIISVGAATISDIYKLEERGTAMGIFFSAILLGPILAPIIGGVLATYASWRVMQLFLFVMALVAFVSVIVFLPETSHPGSRGIDLLLAQEQREGDDISLKKGRWRWVWLNPFKSVGLLRGPVILFVSLAAAFALMTYFVLMIPLSYTLGPRYEITTPAGIGACFIPLGIGNMVGANLAGRLADRAVINGRKRRESKWVPEDRLRATIPGALILLPLSLLIFALANQYVTGWLGLAISLLCLFMTGAGVDFVLAPSATYFVDVLRSQSVQVMAVYTAFRNVLCAIASAFVLPMIDEFGLVTTNAFATVLVWIGFMLLMVTIRYGEKLRGWLDLGYTDLPDVSRSK